MSKNIRGIGAARALVFYPNIAPTVGFAAIWTFLFTPNIGVVSQAMRALSLKPVDFLNNPGTALYAIMAVYIWREASFMMIFYISGLQNISQEYYDAARLDGATVFQTLRYIFIPCTKSAYVSFAICSVSTHWNSFLWPMIVINSPEKRPLTMGLVLFAKANDSGPMWATVTAATLLVMLPLFVMFCLFQKQFVASFVTSGIK